jgi:single-stranded-DNA-specific exonuclease
LNLNKRQIDTLLKTRFSSGFLKLSDFPEPTSLYGIEDAVLLIKKAIRQKEKITVIGDYDVDGVMATAVLKWYFDFIGYAVEYIIPNRFHDGYGISQKIIDRIDTDLIITVDNGISALDAAKRCKQKGIKLIITDHHTPPQTLPDADAIVNPKLSHCSFAYKEICGAQVSWYLVAQLNKELQSNFDIKSLIGDVSIAVIADVMPLVDINRAFVKAGLQLLTQSNKPYIKALMQHLNKSEINSEDIGFNIAPKLNSAGRMDDAIQALNFVTAKTIEQAYEYLEKLNQFNALRKETQSLITDEAIAQVDTNDGVIVVQGSWHEGVIGIAASHLSQKFQKPAIVFSRNDTVLKGSARSYGQTDIYSLIAQEQDLLLGFGGHVAAAGLSIKKENYDAFKKNISKKIYTLIPPQSECLGNLCFKAIDWELVEILQKYEPYGEKNPKPSFYTQKVQITDLKKVGEKKEHKIFTFQKNGVYFKGVKFFCDKEVDKGDIVDIEYKIEKNSFQNQTSIQLQIVKFDL